MNNVAALTHEELTAVWRDPNSSLQWNCLFMLPVWIKAWWDEFGEGEPLRLLVSGNNGSPLGIALLKLQGETASFLGSADVCDYQDIVSAPGFESDFTHCLLDHLRSRGVVRLVLNSVRPDAAAIRMIEAARIAGYQTESEAEDVTVMTSLPNSWEGFLAGLNGKQRHEIRRKIRRLHEAGSVAYRTMDSRAALIESLPEFLQLFKISRTDKADFMTARMERFFESLVDGLSSENIIALYMLELEDKPAAGVMCFEFGSTTYLYNSGYDPRYRSLSVGLLSKAYSIGASIEKGMRQYDFLKGGEPYKFRLGGIPVPLHRYRINLQQSR